MSNLELRQKDNIFTVLRDGVPIFSTFDKDWAFRVYMGRENPPPLLPSPSPPLVTLT